MFFLFFFSLLLLPSIVEALELIVYYLRPHSRHYQALETHSTHVHLHHLGNFQTLLGLHALVLVLLPVPGLALVLPLVHVPPLSIPTPTLSASQHTPPPSATRWDNC